MISHIKQTRTELRDSLLAFGAQLPEPIRSHIADQLTEEILRESNGAPQRGPIIPSPLKGGEYYVVPGDDIDRAETAIKLVVGLLGLMVNPIPLLSTIALLVFKFQRNALSLNADQALVVLTLMNAPDEGWTPSDIVAHLPIERPLDPTQTQNILDQLKNMVVRGKPSPVVLEYHGKWSTNAVWKIL